MIQNKGDNPNPFNLSHISPLAGKKATASILINVQKLVSEYYSEVPDPNLTHEKVVFGTSGHRGSSFTRSFNEAHILAISQAIYLYRQWKKIDGPLFLGLDTHALSKPAFVSALEVLAANGVQLMIAKDDEYTPTPVISHAILQYNKKRSSGLADGIVITPSHDPPHDGGFKYNPPNGGPADLEVTAWIEKKANEFLLNGLKDIKRISFEKAVKANTTQYYDFLNHYVEDLGNVIKMNLIKDAGLRIGVDPLGGAGVHYWKPIAERYQLNLTIVNEVIDPTFSFMTVDWDGQIRMDPSSAYAMESLIRLKDRFDIAFACDTDYDRHGIVTKSAGLLPSNHYLSAAIFYLFQERKEWDKKAGIGKTIVSSQMIDRVANKLKREVYEVPVGFKWFVDGLLTSSLAFAGEESAGASFSRISGDVWSTDKDGIISALLSAEMTAAWGKDPGIIYRELEQELGISYFKRVDTAANLEQKKIIKDLSKKEVTSVLGDVLADEKVQSILNQAPSNHALIGGIKVTSDNAWFAARPSGTENIVRIYAESFNGEQHLEQVLNVALDLIHKVLDKNHE